MIAVALIIMALLLISVKVFDSSIRESKYGKSIVVAIFIGDVLFILVSLIMILIGG